MRSLAVICDELEIPNFEYLLNKDVDNISIEEWANQNLELFKDRQKLLSYEQKMALSLYLKKVEEILRL